MVVVAVRAHAKHVRVASVGMVQAIEHANLGQEIQRTEHRRASDICIDDIDLPDDIFGGKCMFETEDGFGDDPAWTGHTVTVLLEQIQRLIEGHRLHSHRPASPFHGIECSMNGYILPVPARLPGRAAEERK